VPKDWAGEGGEKKGGEKKKKEIFTRHQRLTPVILATQEAEIKRITVQSQSGQIVQETLSQKHP
jgi:hypothetical protein